MNKQITRQLPIVASQDHRAAQDLSWDHHNFGEMERADVKAERLAKMAAAVSGPSSPPPAHCPGDFGAHDDSDEQAQREAFYSPQSPLPAMVTFEPLSVERARTEAAIARGRHPEGKLNPAGGTPRQRKLSAEVARWNCAIEDL